MSLLTTSLATRVALARRITPARFIVFPSLKPT